ncbi:transposase [Rossellomorea aquimaris]|uniref:transposase n=1 Tax=Rossellomorea aquimaris TaxID=189382 RepID=UPI001CD205DA|nr:transposase [Rossellomorea aquimaris]MCA1055154.1 transposase [Rossellomorea aquimaris]
MPRKAREWKPGTYHVYCRGNRKQNIFLEDDDKRKYLSYLLDTKEKYPFKLHAYCLIPNHLHLLLESDVVPLNKILHTQHTRYAIYFNNHHDCVGHLFHGRFGATYVDTTSYFIGLSKYIHLNPTEAGLTISSASYLWSSYPFYLEGIDNPLIDKERTLSYFPNQDLTLYKEYLDRKEEMILLKKSLSEKF